MTREQRIAIGFGQKRAWADPEIKAKRAAAIRAAWDDPLRRSLMSKRKIIIGSRRESEGWYD